MRISDWSSDVCSSDLRRRIPAVEDRAPFGRQHRADALAASASPAGVDGAVLAALPPRPVSLTHLADRRRPPISALFGGGLGGLPVLEGAMGLLEGLAEPAHLRRRVRGRGEIGRAHAAKPRTIGDLVSPLV